MKEECQRAAMAFTMNCDGSGRLRRGGRLVPVVSDMPQILQLVAAL